MSLSVAGLALRLCRSTKPATDLGKTRVGSFSAHSDRGINRSARGRDLTASRPGFSAQIYSSTAKNPGPAAGTAIRPFPP
jgi:hypothetical protein